MILGACSQPAPEEAAAQSNEPAAKKVSIPAAPMGLADILANQPEAVQARFKYRNPQETLEFFGVESGMTVVEALPGGGWYSKLLLPYLGSSGHLIGANYAPDIWSQFPNMSPERIAQAATWTTTWPETAQEWRDSNGAKISAMNLGQVPAELEASADVVLFIRALHNMARFQNRPYLAEAMENAFTLLKPGGVVGVVQHMAPDDADADWANGSRGYLKKDFVIAQAEAAGFEFVAESGVNHNHRDQPGADDIVWRLPPSLATSRENPELKAKMEAIGESNRMTLKFAKPS